MLLCGRNKATDFKSTDQIQPDVDDGVTELLRLSFVPGLFSVVKLWKHIRSGMEKPGLYIIELRELNL